MIRTLLTHVTDEPSGVLLLYLPDSKGWLRRMILAQYAVERLWNLDVNWLARREDEEVDRHEDERQKFADSVRKPAAGLDAGGDPRPAR
jgi:hypothetical protein